MGKLIKLYKSHQYKKNSDYVLTIDTEMGIVTGKTGGIYNVPAMYSNTIINDFLFQLSYLPGDGPIHVCPDYGS